MTPRELFTRAYGRTVAAHGADANPDHAEECWGAVKAYPASLYDEVATRLNATAHWLPKPVEWVEACRVIQGEREMDALRAREADCDAFRHQRTYHCPDCLDTGFCGPFRCLAGARCTKCQRRGYSLYDHTYVTRCACRATNPVIANRVARERDRLGAA